MTLDWPSPAPGEHLLGVIGWPVEQSLSPVLHAAALSELHMRDWRYVHLPVPPEAMPEAVERLRSEHFRGANVTMPHKQVAAKRADVLSEDAARLKVANTLDVQDDGARIVGHNTDAPGFQAFLHSDVAFDAAGATVLIYGAGGAARACVLALARMGAARIVVAVRTPARAVSMTDVVAGHASALSVVPFDEAHLERPDLLVNATPLGTAGELVPLPDDPEGCTVIDLLYHPRRTPLLNAAEEAGRPAYGGLGLLVHQAALSFEIWTGQVAPIEVMRAAGESASPPD